MKKFENMKNSAIGSLMKQNYKLPCMLTCTVLLSANADV